MHTPGNWHYDSDELKGDPLHRVRYRVVTQGKTITQCYYNSDDPHAEDDAKLISAAPDLLAALQTIANLPDEIACISVKHVANTAIAKAKSGASA